MNTIEYLSVAATVVVAYAVFGLTGFGAAMIAVPVLVQVVPINYAVPVVLLLDLVSTTLVGFRNWSHVSTDELKRLFPFLLLGVSIGATLLANFEAKWLLVGLGAFVTAMAMRTLLAADMGPRRVRAAWVIPAGTAGGIFSALFGTGGPIYTMYLSRRLDDVDQFRATIASVIFMSAIVRICAFGATGLLQQDRLVQTAGFALPFSLVGLTIGSRLRRHLSANVVKKMLCIFLAFGGLGVIYRGLAS